MRDQPLTASFTDKLADTPAAASDGPIVTDLTVPVLVEGIEVVELPDRQQRKLKELRSHIDDLLNDGWQIATRNPLTLKQGYRICYVLHGMLISETLG
ncbi:hypothetical protein [Halopseudomonas sp.]|uniref:hypothetical protein n=1 Tax=Halopseudomonas sp. TaxID=2901191 RepID=UPI0035625985